MRERSAFGVVAVFQYVRADLVPDAAPAGILVGFALIAGRVLGSTAAGLASVFPSSWLSAMYLLARDQGADLAGATGRVMVLGSAAPAVFGATGAFLFPVLGLWWGLLAALVAAALATLLVAGLLARLAGVQEAVRTA